MSQDRQLCTLAYHTARTCRGIVVAVVSVVAVPLAGGAAHAQDTAAVVTQHGNLQEFGVDAGATVGFGSTSTFQLTLPAARARVGFFWPNSRWELEPAGMLAYSVASHTVGELLYDVEMGALYHFKETTTLVTGKQLVAYVRPFIGVNGFAGGGSHADFRAGAGLGIKVPWREMIAFRLEGNLGYGFTDKALQLGAFAGISIFTHHRVL